ncbi:hypothetical protein [Campylobacter sp. MG1]|uniref:hypothetical protein n=1 Tax=Campylobacter sp. MG1 TaxID=2976332 RepID=UPI00226CD8EB|nr:hypothetical protein [Campylobacter sp. MG1]
MNAENDLHILQQNTSNAYVKPRSFISALSEIQRFYVLESKTEIPEEFFTLEQIIDYVKLGFLGGVFESFLFIFVFSLLQIFYEPIKIYFFNSDIEYLEIFLLQFISYLPIIITSLLLLFISKYFNGKFTKRAILSLLGGRALSFFLKAIVVFVVFSYFINFVNNNTSSFNSFLDFISSLLMKISNNLTPNFITNFFYEKIFNSVEVVMYNIIFTMMLSGILPYCMVIYKSYKKIHREEKIKYEIDNYK